MRNPADMPELDDDAAACRMDGSGDFPPRGNLLGRVDAGGIEIALRHRADLARFGDNQAGRGALAVVLDGERPGLEALDGAVARERCHDDAVGKRNVADLDGVEECWHDEGPQWLRRLVS